MGGSKGWIPPLSENRFIVVVNASTNYMPPDYSVRALAQLKWLAEMFSKRKYPKRRLVLIHDHWIWFTPGAVGDSLHQWECFDAWEDVYAKLLEGGYAAGPYSPDWLNPLDKAHQFMFGVFINLRLDKSEAGFGYGLCEVRTDRCPLRALLIATRGKAVCLDWGVPSDLGEDYRFTGSVAALPGLLDHDIREYSKARQRRQRRRGEEVTDKGLPDFHDPQQPFARAIRNGHYLGTCSSSLDALPEPVLADLLRGVEDALFTEEQAKRGWWIGWWDLFFAEDCWCVPYHRWRRFPKLQYAAAERFVVARHYTASSSWAELAVDAFSLVACGASFALCDAAAFSARLPSPAALLVGGPFTVMFLSWFWTLWQAYTQRNVPGAHERADRPGHDVFALEFARAAVYAPVFTRPALAVLYRLVLHNIRPRRLGWWYDGVRTKDPANALRLEGTLTLALGLLAWAVPSVSLSWGGVSAPRLE